ncbi:hypothetical protein IFR05_009549 [Cadophora sp. M221]|nr:hypothetical protein IFR05_009549 [Cadophora sp. M221]
MEHSNNNTTAVDAVRDTTDQASDNHTRTRSPKEALQEPVQNTTSANTVATPLAVESLSTTANKMIATAGEDHKDTNNTAKGNHKRSTIEYLAPKVHVNIRRQVLDESGHSCEAVLEALKSQNTDRIANSTVPGTCGILTNTEPAVSARIITSIGMNCVESNRSVLASALNLEKETLRGHERHRLDQIKQGRTQMNMLSAARSQKEEEYREEEHRLPKLTSRGRKRKKTEPEASEAELEPEVEVVSSTKKAKIDKGTRVRRRRSSAVEAGKPEAEPEPQPGPQLEPQPEPQLEPVPWRAPEARMY